VISLVTPTPDSARTEHSRSSCTTSTARLAGSLPLRRSRGAGQVSRALEAQQGGLQEMMRLALTSEFPPREFDVAVDAHQQIIEIVATPRAKRFNDSRRSTRNRYSCARLRSVMSTHDTAPQSGRPSPSETIWMTPPAISVVPSVW